MKSIITTILLSGLCAVSAMAQKPHYLLGDGIYIVGIPANQTKPFDGPVMVTESYKAKFITTGAEMASIKTDKSINISNRLMDDGTLDLVSFMGTGMAKNLTVRNYDGESYTIGDYAPEKTWTDSYLVAGYAPWNGNAVYTLGVYDHWDCPVTFVADEMITSQHYNTIVVDFGNPQEGLICQGVNFNLISADDNLASKVSGFTVGIKVGDDSEGAEYIEYSGLSAQNVSKIGTTDEGNNLYAVNLRFSNNILLNQHFTVEIDGLCSAETDVWLPRAVDTHNLYPTHTTYLNGNDKVSVAESDACVNINGYFNYVGQWGWPNGKEEYGEVVAGGDYVQVYYDPTDPDWPGEFFTGEVTFPVECTFGYQDLAVTECPEWISEVEVNDSQWAEYEALLIIMTADALPNGETGRLGDVVVSTKDGASTYTVHIRQGNATFTGVDGPVIDLPAEGGMFDLSGRRITTAQPGQIIINNGKKYIKR